MSNAKKGVKFVFDDKELYLKFNFATYSDLQEAFGMPLEEYIEGKGEENLNINDIGTIFYAIVNSNCLDFMSKREFLMKLDMENVEHYAKTLTECFEFSNKGPSPKTKKGKKKNSPLVTKEDQKKK